ncbi:hypothetical protein Tco_1562031 [Tanacetum coccineum]
MRGLEYPEYLAPSDNEIPVEGHPLPADASPIALSLGYVADSDLLEEDLEEDPEEDPVDYPADEGDDDEESSKEDDDEEEEAFTDEEEEQLAPADSTLPAIDFVPSTKETKPFETDEARLFVRPHTTPSPSTEALIVEYASAPIPSTLPPSPLSPLLSLLPRILSPPLLLPPLHTSPTYARAPLGYKAAMIPSPPLPLPSSPLLLQYADRRSDIPEADMPSRKRLCLTALASRFEVEESSAATTIRQTGHTLARRVDYRFIDTLDASIRATKGRVMTAIEVVNERVTDLTTTQRQDSHEFYVLHEDAQDDRALNTALEALIRAQEAGITALDAQIRALQRDVSVLQRQRNDDGDKLTMHIQHEHDIYRELERTRDAEHQDGPADACSSVADALAEYEANRSSGNGNDSHDSGSGRRRTEHTTRECTYIDFLKCQPLNFKGTEGVVGLTQWFEKMESVFHISNCTVVCQLKYATCTLLGSTLTWWNSHIKIVGHDAAYEMP